jgi:hypothetical protein
MDESIRNGYENITIKFKGKSNATAEELADLTRISPVFDIVSNPVPAKVELEVT